jgi:hypothetical protein
MIGHHGISLEVLVVLPHEKITGPELRQQSLILLAHARQIHADAQVARRQAVKCRATTATLSSVARIIVSKAATRRNAERQAVAPDRHIHGGGRRGPVIAAK